MKSTNNCTEGHAPVFMYNYICFVHFGTWWRVFCMHPVVLNTFMAGLFIHATSSELGVTSAHTHAERIAVLHYCPLHFFEIHVAVLILVHVLQHLWAYRIFFQTTNSSYQTAWHCWTIVTEQCLFHIFISAVKGITLEHCSKLGVAQMAIAVPVHPVDTEGRCGHQECRMSPAVSGPICIYIPFHIYLYRPIPILIPRFDNLPDDAQRTCQGPWGMGHQ